ncbi:hypothetical protein LWI29_033875 [Acer saccharum]|uniref:Uncharacterized protein n=1 Tax=Acer saccharum TaxID=4024 RepID=A0AA39VCF1_ACESA|nr:hypothetical protein LWI29_033875 [Acer saccharum]
MRHEPSRSDGFRNGGGLFKEDPVGGRKEPTSQRTGSRDMSVDRVVGKAVAKVVKGREGEVGDHARKNFGIAHVKEVYTVKETIPINKGLTQKSNHEYDSSVGGKFQKEILNTNDLIEVKVSVAKGKSIVGENKGNKSGLELLPVEMEMDQGMGRIVANVVNTSGKAEMCVV